MGLSNAERQARWRAKRDAEIESLRAAQPAKSSPADAARIAALERTVREQAAALARLRAKPSKVKTPRPAPPPDEERERQIAALKTANANLRTKLKAMAKHYRDSIDAHGGMPRATQVAIDKALHPDRRSQLSAAELDATCKAWNAFKNSRDKAMRPR